MSNCTGCSEKPADVPYIVHEAAMARAERHTKRMFTALLVAIALIVVSNAAWLWYIGQYDYSAEEIVTVDAQDGTANYIGNDGDIINGENSR